VVAGGVSANQSLRQVLDAMGKKLDVEVFYPRQEFCTDNGAMIALAGHLRLVKGQVSAGNEIIVKPRWSLEELEAV
jgi:N6-L-threonylcarbamoyladenine synthase